MQHAAAQFQHHAQWPIGEVQRELQVQIEAALGLQAHAQVAQQLPGLDRHPDVAHRQTIALERHLGKAAFQLQCRAEVPVAPIGVEGGQAQLAQGAGFGLTGFLVGRVQSQQLARQLGDPALLAADAESVNKLAQERGIDAIHQFMGQFGFGKLTGIDNQVDSTTGTLRLKAEFPNANYQLWPGQFVNVRLLVETLKDVVVVPTGAVQRGPRGTFVYVVKDDNTWATMISESEERVNGMKTTPR